MKRPHRLVPQVTSLEGRALMSVLAPGAKVAAVPMAVAPVRAISGTVSGGVTMTPNLIQFTSITGSVTGIGRVTGKGAVYVNQNRTTIGFVQLDAPNNAGTVIVAIPGGQVLPQTASSRFTLRLPIAVKTGVFANINASVLSTTITATITRMVGTTGTGRFTGTLRS